MLTKIKELIFGPTVKYIDFEIVEPDTNHLVNAFSMSVKEINDNFTAALRSHLRDVMGVLDHDLNIIQASPESSIVTIISHNKKFIKYKINRIPDSEVLHKMDHVNISKEDLKRLLEENTHMRQQIIELQNHGTELLTESRDLKKELEKLRQAIRYHRDQKGDDRCWVDDLRLYELLPEGAVGYDSTLPPEEVFLENCKRFCRTRQVPVGQPFKKDW